MEETEMTEETIIELRQAYEGHRDPETARAMEAYMRDQYPFLGVKAPMRREVMNAFFKLHSPRKEWVEPLWALPEREFACVAIDILVKVRKTLVPEDIALIEHCIVTNSWWDTVDGLASNVVGYLFDRYPTLRDEYAPKWASSDNMWLNRTAILFQLGYKGKTDEARLYDYIRQHAGSTPFFIQKAIGWALREYSKTNPESVVRFIEEHDLKPLSRREGLKWLNRGKLFDGAANRMK